MRWKSSLVGLVALMVCLSGQVAVGETFKLKLKNDEPGDSDNAEVKIRGGGPYVSPALRIIAEQNVILVGVAKGNVAIYQSDDESVQTKLFAMKIVKSVEKVEAFAKGTDNSVQLNVRYEKGARDDVSKTLAALGLKVEEDYKPGRFFIARSGKRGLTPKQLRGLTALEGVEVLEPNFVQSIPNDDAGIQQKANPAAGDGVSIRATVPNDPEWPLWGMQYLNCPLAWDCGQSSTKVVAVIDTGIDLDHPDLVNNLWSGPNGEHGYDFANNDNDPDDDNGHGTHCAGTVGAEGNNGQGVVGVTWSVKLMAMKFLTGSGSGSTTNAIKCIDWAVKNDADVLSNSWGGGGYSQLLKDAIDRAEAKGVIFIAAAGNSGTDNDRTPHYPSSYNNESIIAVASHKRDGNRSGFSCVGATSVDLAAPGSSINSTWPGGGTRSISGTSMATPHVAGVIALAWSRPEHASKDWRGIKSLVKRMTVASPDWRGKVAWGGTLKIDSLADCGSETDPRDLEQIVLELPEAMTASAKVEGSTLRVTLTPVDPTTQDAAIIAEAPLESFPQVSP